MPAYGTGPPHIATDVRDTFWAEGEHQGHPGPNAPCRSVDHLEVLSAEHPGLSEEGRRSAGSSNPEEGKAVPQGDYGIRRSCPLAALSRSDPFLQRQLL